MEQDDGYDGVGGSGSGQYALNAGSMYSMPGSSRGAFQQPEPELNEDGSNATASPYPPLLSSIPLTPAQQHQPAQHPANFLPRQPQNFSQVPLHASFYEQSSQSLPPMVSIPHPPNLPPEPTWNGGFASPVLDGVPGSITNVAPIAPAPPVSAPEPAAEKRDSVSSTSEAPGAQPLRRNQACLSCRKRKLRCDAVRPVCGTCARSKAAAAANKQTAPVPAGACTYDDESPADVADAVQSGASNPAPTPSKPARKRRRESAAGNAKASKASPQAAAAAAQPKQTAAGSSKSSQFQVPALPASARASPGNHAQASYSPLQAAAPESAEPPTVAALQSRVVELEKLLAAAREQSANGLDARTRTKSQPTPGTGAVPIYSMLSPSSGREERLRVQYQQRTIPAPSGASSSRSPGSVDAGDKGSASAESAHKELFDAEMGMHGGGLDIQGAPMAEATVALLNEPDPFLELLWPGWPTDLPTPYVVSTLARIFFEKHPMRNLIYKPMFMAGLSLPPRHPNRPHESLIHAILACAAPFSPFHNANVDTSYNERTVPMLGNGCEPQQPAKMSFQDFHLAKARAKVERGLFQQNRNPLDWIQALLLSCWCLWQECRIMEAFFVNAVLARALAPSGMDKLQSLHKEDAHDTGLFGAPANHVVEHERRTALWWCYILDQLNAGIPRYWEPLISEEMVQAELPIAMAHFQAGLDPPLTNQTLRSPELFRSGHTDDFTLHIKSVILQKRVQVFCCRNHVSSNPGRKPAGLNQLNTYVDEFLSSFPPSRFSAEVSVDRLVAYSNLHVALVYLHEHFLSDTDDGESSYSLQRVQQGTSGILSAVHDLMSSSFDFQLLHPSTFLHWGVAGRMLAKERDRLSRRTQGQDVVRMQQVTDALDFLISALSRGAEKSVRARRVKELLLAVRAGLLPESAVADLLYLDTAIPLEDENDAPAQSFQHNPLPDLAITDASALDAFDLFAAPGPLHPQ